MDLIAGCHRKDDSVKATSKVSKSDHNYGYKNILNGMKSREKFRVITCFESSVLILQPVYSVSVFIPAGTFRQGYFPNFLSSRKFSY